MLQQTEIQRRLVRIEQDIDDALHTCEENVEFPRNLKASVMRWKRQSEEARKVFESSDSYRMHACIDQLQKTGKRTQAALEEVIEPDVGMRNCIMHANSELADLKWQMH